MNMEQEKPARADVKAEFEALHDSAYEKYQLQWMTAHGFSASRLVLSVLRYMLETTSDLDVNPEHVMSGWEADSGFQGELWACKDEFLQSEYEDRSYMENLLTERELALYDQERERKQNPYAEVYIYVPDKGQVLRIDEGTGDNLLAEDEEAGYVDYIYYDVYDAAIRTEIDGGQVMLTELFRDKYESTMDCIPDVLDMEYGDPDLAYVVLQERDEKEDGEMLGANYHAWSNMHPFIGEKTVALRGTISKDAALDACFNGRVKNITRGKTYDIHKVVGYGDVAVFYFTDDAGEEQWLCDFCFEKSES